MQVFTLDLKIPNLYNVLTCHFMYGIVMFVGWGEIQSYHTHINQPRIIKAYLIGYFNELLSSTLKKKLLAHYHQTCRALPIRGHVFTKGVIHHT